MSESQRPTKDANRKKVAAPRTAREVALQVLTQVEEDGAYSNMQLHGALQRSELKGADAGLATELVYGTISRLSTIDYFLEPFVAKGMKKLQPWVRNLLRLSFYQLYYLDRIPAHAAVNEAVNIAKKRGHQGISGMVNGVLRNVLRRKDELKLPEHLPAAERIALEHAHPQWLVERWISQYGEEVTNAMCQANNEPPSVSVRVNQTKLTRDELLSQMHVAQVDAIPSSLSEDGIIVRSGGNMALTDWYRDGRLSIQDESSMLVAAAVDPKSGMRVLDCCAAPGGKSMHLAEKLGLKGEIIANDIHPHKAKLIEDQAIRLGLHTIRTTTGDALEMQSLYPAASFDRILLDAPCSGLGVIRRKPDLKWAKQAEDIEDISKLQLELLERTASLLKKDGILVYSTCTVEKQENEELIRTFLKKHPEFSEAEPILQGSSNASRAEIGLQILPQDYHSDGFYIARLVKLG
ncbi:16S rRNA (cytosine967-C5)-methyltransferase [Paenibacillus shirakamiensis]|uniref:16S rRNA (cytosine(967)-C(5))-methyltransferase n=1 Tax=Paenibacillus shirakamiensis TaxID=1265935 RepID=A0ABS4JC97_9BACL|nr:16S rRNA (cytosine(967)-C(5))-methyltransferase RsmB [Paenibacillus shirakamiensis]MBP1999353.1 16S rRNA (cytosine967-C5)-methyltransferase [Paenibacillus shirakamiensis]